MKSVHIIANPVAGGGKGLTQAHALVSALESRDIPVTLFITGKAGDGQAEAGRTATDVVAVVGGDGTLNEVLNGLPEATESALAILPVGTANVVARELGMRSDPEFVADAITSGNTVAMDVGIHDKQRFLLGAGAGLDAAITHAVQSGRGNKSNLAKWVLPALRVILGANYPKIRVTVDDEVVAEDGDYVIVGNCRYSAGVFPATPHADISDHKLDVCVMRQLTWLRLIWLVLRVWNPDFVNAPWIAYRQGQHITLEPADSESPVLMQIDGDPAGQLPATFSLTNWSIRMVRPTGSAGVSPVK
ncbi:MAG: diacylglycerol kinase family lipid kinase [Candidatus Hydrogenedentes bacterium]|nr:diacylglycerol kinase family lipid kinase [Candidatus Hydrogenedentota bacterium]